MITIEVPVTLPDSDRPCSECEFFGEDSEWCSLFNTAVDGDYRRDACRKLVEKEEDFIRSI